MRGRLMEQKTSCVAIAVYRAVTDTHYLPSPLFILNSSPLLVWASYLVRSPRSSSPRSLNFWFLRLSQAVAPTFVHLPSKLDK